MRPLQLSMSTYTLHGESKTSIMTSWRRGHRAAAAESRTWALQIFETFKDLSGLTCLHVVIAVLGYSD